MTSDNNIIKVLDLLCDPKACYVLDRIYEAHDNGAEGYVIANQANLSPARFYRLMSSLREQSLIEKRKQRYFITLFGSTVYSAKRIVQKALDNYYRLKVIDSLKEQREISVTELNELIGIFIEDYQLKDILIKHRAQNQESSQ